MNDASKVQIRGRGIGDIDLSLIEERAKEIARMDGRNRPNESDIEHAEDDLLSARDVPPPPEVDERTDQITSWDESPEEHGCQAPRAEQEDEKNVVEQLVLQGLEEADHDSRVEAEETKRRSG